MRHQVDDAEAALRAAGIGRGDLVALAWAAEVGVALVAVPPGTDAPAGDPPSIVTVAGTEDAVSLVGRVEAALSPRWVLWSRAESAALLAAGVRLGSCWDLAAVHRLQHGGWKAGPGRVWALHRGLDPDDAPRRRRGDPAVVDLFTAAEQADGDVEDPVRPDGHLRPEWGSPQWQPTIEQLARWATLALEVATAQVDERRRLAHRPDDPRPLAPMVARSESTVELLCNELAAGGLPVDRASAEGLVAEIVGPRPTSPADADAQRRRRDAEVLQHVPGGDTVDLRSPGQVKSLLRRVGIEVEDTRAWRLESLVDAHPVVGPLLRWRKAERIATTFGYDWLDTHLGPDGRLRGEWTGCDGAAGRMTASAGLHNMPSELRPAVAAEPGHAFVRADLGQIEPRVLAAVSGDPALAVATRSDDLYAGVAETLGVERELAKVAVLGAMYGQTTGRGAQALAELRRAYPVAMALLDGADTAARAGRDLRTHGGRSIRMDAGGDLALGEHAARSRAAARGRYGRNAIIQGAAAELFKMWALTVRARVTDVGAEVVLCLHDELLVHVPRDDAARAAEIVDASLQETVHRWAPERTVRFLADTSVIDRWSDAKG